MCKKDIPESAVADLQAALNNLHSVASKHHAKLLFNSDTGGMMAVPEDAYVVYDGELDDTSDRFIDPSSDELRCIGSFDTYFGDADGIAVPAN